MSSISEIGNVGVEGKHAGETRQSTPTTPDGWYEWWLANDRYGKELWKVNYNDVAEPYHSYISIIEDPRKLPWWSGLAQEYVRDDFWVLNIQISTTEVTVKKYIQD